MEFFDRTKEIGILRRIRKDSAKSARFTVITGRRRVGKTELIKRAFSDEGFVYFFIARRTEAELCEIFVKEIADKLGVVIPGRVGRICDLVKFVMNLAKDRPITLVIDEFQEMKYVNEAFYGELQGVWDRIHRTHKLNLVVSGSVNRMMNEILFNYSAALYGRNTAHLRLDPFPVSLLKKILKDHSPRYTNGDLLDLWAITGGVARYVAMLMDAGAVRRKKMLSFIFSPLSPFIEEGRSVLAQEFGTEYTNYFSILTSIASGHTRFSEIEQDLGLQVVPYLNNLEKNYGIS